MEPEETIGAETEHRPLRRRSKRLPRETAVGSGVDESAWRAVHPLTPLAQTWAVIAGVAAFFTYQFADLLRDIREVVEEVSGEDTLSSFGLPEILMAVAVFIVVVIAIAGVYSWLAWRRISYAITPEAVYYRSGILSRSQRHARLNRIQAVNITHTLIGRLFKLGNIDIEVAGGAGSSLKFGLLKTDDLERVRREILLRVAEVKDQSELAETATTSGETQDHLAPGPSRIAEPSLSTGGDDGQLIYRVDTTRLLLSTLLNMGILIAILVFLAAVVLGIVLVILFPINIMNLLYLGVFALSIGGFAWNAFAKSYGFRAYVTDDGIRIRAGLTSTRAQTVPVDRIHAVEVIQPFFWRFFGWYKVTIAQAGFAGDAEQQESANVLLPVGSRDEMLRAVWMVYPELGVTDPIGTLNFGIEGTGPGYDFLPNPRRARIFDWITWRRRAILLTDTVVLIRSGRITRNLTVLSYSRLQSASLHQGPLDRRRKLANISFHLVDVTAVNDSQMHMDEQLAIDVFGRITACALDKRKRESSREWERRMNTNVGRAGEELFNSPHPERRPTIPTSLHSDEEEV
ncbi:MAG: PH domain-containing protein [Actinomycetaceae bacterium]|nr:PH domain-containing protein [Actinomycetaceae bacterium]